MIRAILTQLKWYNRLSTQNQGFISNLIYEMKNSVQLFTPDFLNIQYVDRPKCDNWLHQLNFFNNWLDTLRDELNSKDLWEEIGKYQSSIEPHLYQETTNDNFTKEEIEKLLSGIEQVKGYLQEHSTASEYQIDSAIAQLDYLAGQKLQTDRDVRIGFIPALACSSLFRLHSHWHLNKPNIFGVY